MDIKINIEKQKLYLKKEPHEGPYIVSDSINYLQCTFKFSDDWTDFDKTATFKDDIGNAYSILLENDKCFVPYEVLSGNNFKVSVFGSKDAVRITTNEVVVPIVPSGYTEGKTPSKPPKTAYELILDKLRQIGTLLRLKTNNKETLVDAINEVIGYVDSKADQSALDVTDAKIGNVEELTTPTHKVVVSAINYLLHHCEGNRDELVIRTDRLEGMIGQPEHLQTTDKSNTVAAINELVGDMGDIGTALDEIIALQNSLIGGDSV